MIELRAVPVEGRPGVIETAWAKMAERLWMVTCSRCGVVSQATTQRDAVAQAVGHASSHRRAN